MLQKGRIVKSLAGRDSGKLLAVLRADEKTAVLCDGKERPIDRPKTKNIRHIAETEFLLSEEEMSTDRKLRKAIAAIELNCSHKES